MFTIKHFLSDSDSYTAVSCSKYTVQRESGCFTEPVNGREWEYATIHVDGHDSILVTGNAYIENAAGKTIDVIRPRPVPKSAA